MIAAAVATRSPDAVRKPIAWPCSMKKVQSSAVWFQPAPLDSASPPATSASVSVPSESASEAAIADLELGRLVEARPFGRDPIGDPVEHATERNLRIAEQRSRARGIGKQRRRRFLAGDL